ncbi:MAG TPA: tetratricopeptide repeat protein [Blastocatellia bacterium]|nr:tetratricopeptide repeat protein [Blastocatellia bacterium]
MKFRRPVLNALLCFAAISTLLLSSPAGTFAQDIPDYEAEFKRAAELVQANKMIEASPLLEKLHAAKPDDAVVLELLSYVISATAVVEKDPVKRKKDFLRARSLAGRAKELGRNTQLVQLILEQISPDGMWGGQPAPEKRTPAEDALMEGEEAFTKGEMDLAIEHYERALKLDPKLYDAPLFIGDAYHKMGKNDKAYESYARAVAIDPDRDTAYRYWGNVLMREDKLKEAKEKLIEGVIANPYTRLTWQFLANWAERGNVQLGHPRVDIPTSSVQRKDDKNVEILLNPSEKKDGTEAWTMYSIARAAWMTEEKFSKEFPNEKQYRHSMREESDALRLTAEMVLEQLKKGTLKEASLDVSIANLLKLHRDGLLEVYVLFVKADEGIARDYAEYRKNNRDKLRRYLNEYVTAGK